MFIKQKKNCLRCTSYIDESETDCMYKDIRLDLIYMYIIANGKRYIFHDNSALKSICV